MSHSASSVSPTIASAGEKKSIFRLKALRSYAGRKQQTASYTLVAPRSLYLLWLLALLTVFIGVITWLSKIPVYIPAVAVITDRPASQDEPAIILVFVPADQFGNLRVEQNVVLNPNAFPHGAIAKIFAIEPELLNAQAAQKRFDLRIKPSNVGEHEAVALARLVRPDSSMFPDNRSDPIQVWVQIDSKPVVSLFPSIRRAIQPTGTQTVSCGRNPQTITTKKEEDCMCKLDVVRAWKDEDYRMGLSEAERRMLPANPAGLIEISDIELGAVAGGEEGGPGGMSFPGVCSCFGGCQSQFFQICSADWRPCTIDVFFCPLFPIET